MKRIIHILIILVATFCAWLLLYKPTQIPEKNVTQQAQPQSTNVAPMRYAPSPAMATTNAFVRPSSIDEEHWNQLMQARQIILEQNQSIEFYVRVLDQNEQPVEGATLQITLSRIDEKLFETTNFFSMKMGDEIVHLPMKLVSDAEGWIKLNGVTGKALWIESLDKEGYSWTRPQLDSFAYEPNGQRTVGYAGMEDAFNPEKGYILHLQKMEQTKSTNSVGK
jgi:hypothetical protein